MSLGNHNYYTLRIVLKDGSILSPRIKANSDIRALFNLYNKHRADLEHKIVSINIGEAIPVTPHEKQKRLNMKKAQRYAAKKKRERKLRSIYFNPNSE